jgi:DNA polymerase-1
LKKTRDDEKGKYSTDKTVLNQFTSEGVKFAEYILEYRTLNKLKSTYLDSVYSVGPKGTIETILDKKNMAHPDYYHFGTNTGRLSSGKGGEDSL